MRDKRELDNPIEIFGYFLNLALSDDNKEEKHDDSVQSVE